MREGLPSFEQPSGLKNVEVSSKSAGDVLYAIERTVVAKLQDKKMDVFVSKVGILLNELRESLAARVNFTLTAEEQKTLQSQLEPLLLQIADNEAEYIKGMSKVESLSELDAVRQQKNALILESVKGIMDEI